MQISYGRPSRRLPYLQQLPPHQRQAGGWAGVACYGVRHPKAEAEAAAKAAAAAEYGVSIASLPSVLGPYQPADAVRQGIL